MGEGVTMMLLEDDRQGDSKDSIFPPLASNDHTNMVTENFFMGTDGLCAIDKLY